MSETHELGGSTIVVDRATPKVLNVKGFDVKKNKICNTHN